MCAQLVTGKAVRKQLPLLASLQTTERYVMPVCIQSPLIQVITARLAAACCR